MIQKMLRLKSMRIITIVFQADFLSRFKSMYNNIDTTIGFSSIKKILLKCKKR